MDMLAEQLERARDEVRELKDARQALYARIATLEEANTALRREWASFEEATVAPIARAMAQVAALEEENRRLKERNDTQAQTIGTYLAREEDLRGYVVWHRHDGDIVKIVPVSEAEELVPGATVSVSYKPFPEEVS